VIELKKINQRLQQISSIRALNPLQGAQARLGAKIKNRKLKTKT
jgi:hypothetical protein